MLGILKSILMARLSNVAHLDFAFLQHPFKERLEATVAVVDGTRGQASILQQMDKKSFNMLPFNTTGEFGHSPDFKESNELLCGIQVCLLSLEGAVHSPEC